MLPKYLVVESLAADQSPLALCTGALLHWGTGSGKTAAGLLALAVKATEVGGRCVIVTGTVQGGVEVKAAADRAGVHVGLATGRAKVEAAARETPYVESSYQIVVCCYEQLQHLPVTLSESPVVAIAVDEADMSTPCDATRPELRHGVQNFAARCNSVYKPNGNPYTYKHDQCKPLTGPNGAEQTNFIPISPRIVLSLCTATVPSPGYGGAAGLLAAVGAPLLHVLHQAAANRVHQVTYTVGEMVDQQVSVPGTEPAEQQSRYRPKEIDWDACLDTVKQIHGWLPKPMSGGEGQESLIIKFGSVAVLLAHAKLIEGDDDLYPHHEIIKYHRSTASNPCDHTAAAAAFLQPGPKLILCTMAMDRSANVPNLRYCVSVCANGSITDLLQFAGRLGRENAAAAGPAPGGRLQCMILSTKFKNGALKLEASRTKAFITQSAQASTNTASLPESDRDALLKTWTELSAYQAVLRLAAIQAVCIPAAMTTLALGESSPTTHCDRCTGCSGTDARSTQTLTGATDICKLVLSCIDAMNEHQPGSSKFTNVLNVLCGQQKKVASLKFADGQLALFLGKLSTLPKARGKRRCSSAKPDQCRNILEYYILAGYIKYTCSTDITSFDHTKFAPHLAVTARGRAVVAGGASALLPDGLMMQLEGAEPGGKRGAAPGGKRNSDQQHTPSGKYGYAVDGSTKDGNLTFQDAKHFAECMRRDPFGSTFDHETALNWKVLTQTPGGPPAQSPMYSACPKWGDGLIRIPKAVMDHIFNNTGNHMLSCGETPGGWLEILHRYLPHTFYGVRWTTHSDGNGTSPTKISAESLFQPKSLKDVQRIEIFCAHRNSQEVTGDSPITDQVCRTKLQLTPVVEEGSPRCTAVVADGDYLFVAKEDGIKPRVKSGGGGKLRVTQGTQVETQVSRDQAKGKCHVHVAGHKPARQKVTVDGCETREQRMVNTAPHPANSHSTASRIAKASAPSGYFEAAQKQALLGARGGIPAMLGGPSARSMHHQHWKTKGKSKDDRNTENGGHNVESGLHACLVQGSHWYEEMQVDLLSLSRTGASRAEVESLKEWVALIKRGYITKTMSNNDTGSGGKRKVFAPPPPCGEQPAAAAGVGVGVVGRVWVGVGRCACGGCVAAVRGVVVVLVVCVCVCVWLMCGLGG
jgi:hypothetical protein